MQRESIHRIAANNGIPASIMADGEKDTGERLAILETEIKMVSRTLREMSQSLKEVAKATNKMDRIEDKFDGRIQGLSNEMNSIRRSLTGDIDRIAANVKALDSDKDSVNQNINKIEKDLESTRVIQNARWWIISTLVLIGSIVGGWVIPFILKLLFE